MTTILADSFTASLARLANFEQKQAQLTSGLTHRLLRDNM